MTDSSYDLNHDERQEAGEEPVESQPRHEAQPEPRARRRRRPQQMPESAPEESFSADRDDGSAIGLSETDAVPAENAAWLTSLDAETLERALDSGHLRAASSGGYTKRSVENLMDALHAPEGAPEGLLRDLGLDGKEADRDARDAAKDAAPAADELAGEYDPEIEREFHEEMAYREAPYREASGENPAGNTAGAEVPDEDPLPRPPGATPAQRPERGRAASDSRPRAPGAAAGGFRRSLSALTTRIRRIDEGAHLRPDSRPETNGSTERTASARTRPNAMASAAAAAASLEEREAEEREQELKVSLRDTSLSGFKRLAVGSPKGGVGKSSIAYAVAGAIAYFSDLRVCLVDADPNFGSLRLLVPRPVEDSVVTLAPRQHEDIEEFSQLREYVARNELLRLDALLGPPEAAQLTRFDDLAEAYASVDRKLKKHYNLVIYDMGLGFSHPVIEQILGLSDELLLVGDGEIIPNAMLTDAMNYLAGLNIDVSNITLVLNHRQARRNESGESEEIRAAHQDSLRRMTQVFYDPEFSRALNQRSFHIEDLSLRTRLGILSTAVAALVGLRQDQPDDPFGQRKGA